MAHGFSDYVDSLRSSNYETHTITDNRWSKLFKDRHQRQDNDDRDYDDMSVLSDDTEDSWDERVTHSSHRKDGNSIMLSRKHTSSIRLQECYRREQTAYVAELKAAGKVLAFPHFCQLPPELRLRIWEMHCPRMLRSQRVLQLTLLADGNIQPATSMEEQTKSTREFMRICQETRALGEQYMPDTLSLGEFMYDDSILRYNAQRDILHFTEESKWSLDDVKFALDKQKASDGSDESTKSKMGTTKKNESANLIGFPHTSVRNIAICDTERRTREAGNYHDNDYYSGYQHFERIRPGKVSHRAPKELLKSGWSDEMDYLFPNVENVYALESGGPRKINRWIGLDRSYERHHIRTIETEEYSDIKKPRDYLYCWHGPPKGFRGRQALPVDGEAAPGGGDTKKVVKASLAKDEAEAGDGDFKDDCIINHFSRLRNKGVRFSRMLYFARQAGMEDYYRLRCLSCPDGTWPKDEKGGPWKDEKLRVTMDCDDDSDGFDDPTYQSEDDDY